MYGIYATLASRLQELQAELRMLLVACLPEFFEKNTIVIMQ